MTSPDRTPSIPSSPQSPISSADVFSADEVADSASDSSEDDEDVEYQPPRFSSNYGNNNNIEEYEGGGEEEELEEEEEEEEQLDERAFFSEVPVGLAVETELHDQNPNFRESTESLASVLNELNEVMGEINEVMLHADSTVARVVADGFRAENVIDVPDDEEERVAPTATQGDFQEVRGNRAKCENLETQAGIDADTSLNCPICMEPWTSSGNHRISCLPCGHLFGWSCIRKWIQQGGKRIGKCPHCNNKCKVSEIRILYVPRIAVADGEMQQELTLLQAENDKLKLENKNLVEDNHQIKEEHGHYMDIKSLRVEKQILLDEIQRLHGQKALLAATVSEPYGSPSGCHMTRFDVRDEWKRHELYEPLLKKRHTLSNDVIHLPKQGSTSSCFGMNRGIQHSFELQAQLELEGGRYFDMDASSQMLLVSQKASDLGNVHFLTKISFLAFRGGDKIHLPDGTGAIRDLHIAPIGTGEPGRLALVASMGKKLSLVSLQTKNVVLTYNLECPAWSCAWDINDPQRVYAGLQNGKLLIFDLRKTSSPTNGISSSNNKPIHTLHSVASFRGSNDEYGGRAVLGASCVGPALWNVEDPICRSYSIPGPENQGACISVAYCSKSDIAVASYRPFVGPQFGAPACSSSSMEGTISSQCISAEGFVDPSSLARPPRMGSHFVLTRNGRNPQFGNPMAHQEVSAAGVGWNFNSEKVMRGSVSAVGVPKSAIITLETSGRGPDCKQSLFACGDECIKAVSLWDVQCLSTLNSLQPHETPIQDVKHVQMQGTDILGCVSEKKLQIYAYSK
ncbi:hypothetical protein SUGI_0820600 [Cryptomeria japonica]|uniref:uncharacterized protein LOC131050581 isoform X2 n=1 Tax=Cryptomeria japonica TaxID=3369 RepID=UPI0024149D8F|nr:uncharacterized protein LOC131050581 isoform X2 [Cryptomeria japonica]GLJ40076.1 hypothetical protein SUGI_0820600 [Cryptomeria japonica]